MATCCDLPAQSGRRIRCPAGRSAVLDDDFAGCPGPSQSPPASGSEPGSTADLVRFAIKQHIVPDCSPASPRKKGDFRALPRYFPHLAQRDVPDARPSVHAVACGRIGMTGKRPDRDWGIERDTTTCGARRGSSSDGNRAAQAPVADYDIVEIVQDGAALIEAAGRATGLTRSSAISRCHASTGSPPPRRFSRLDGRANRVRHGPG